jgi:hypothetical protein
MKFKLPDQEELNARSEEAIKRYLAMDPKEAKVELIIQMQGWIGSRAAHRHRISDSLLDIMEICSTIGIAQLNSDPKRESKILRDIYEKKGKQ